MTSRIVCIHRSPRRKPEPQPVDLQHMRAVRRFVKQYSELQELRDNARGEDQMNHVIVLMQKLERTVRFIGTVA